MGKYKKERKEGRDERGKGRGGEQRWGHPIDISGYAYVDFTVKERTHRINLGSDASARK